MMFLVKDSLHLLNQELEETVINWSNQDVKQF